eukprot:jgi/Tetstr1/426018/TSEL_016365.t1
MIRRGRVLLGMPLLLPVTVLLGLVGAAHGLWLGGRASATSIPDARDCRVCHSCIYPHKAEKALEQPKVDDNDPLWSKYVPSWDPNSTKPVCSMCRGCSTVSNVLLPTTDFRGYSTGIIDGHSSASILRMSSSRAKQGYAIGKVWCLPFSGHACTPIGEAFATMVMDKIVALEGVNRDCGFSEIIPASWVETVTTILPGTGIVYHGPALMMDVADGVSFKSTERLPGEVQVEMYKSLNSTQVLMASIFDALVQQRDRNTGNAFVSEDGQVSLIDNDKVLSEGENSIFLSNTAYYLYNIFGREYVRYNGYNISATPTASTPKASLALDYRCHVKKGVLGNNFPRNIKKCLADISALSPVELQEKYGFPELKQAAALWERANVLSRYGMEWALEHSTVDNECMKYFWHKPCCSWRQPVDSEKNEFGRIMCADPEWRPWELKYPLPCKGLDYMYVKYRMIDMADDTGEEFDLESYDAWIREMAPPTRCTDVVPGTEETLPWDLHRTHAEVDPTLHCAKPPGGSKWKSFMAEKLQSVEGGKGGGRRLPRLGSGAVHFLADPHAPQESSAVRRAHKAWRSMHEDEM